MRIERLEGFLPAEFEALLLASQREGIRTVSRLVADHASGENRFAAPGEFLLVARDEAGRILGVCGLNRVNDQTARVRRFYVLPEARNAGIGSSLLRELLRRQSFSRLELRAMTAGAARFYERHGFSAVSAEGFTHALEV